MNYVKILSSTKNMPTNMYLVKLDKVLSFLNTTKQVFKLKTLNKPKSINKKVKNEFGNSSCLWQRKLFTELITNLLLILRNIFVPKPIFKIGTLKMSTTELRVPYREISRSDIFCEKLKLDIYSHLHDHHGSSGTKSSFYSFFL